MKCSSLVRIPKYYLLIYASLKVSCTPSSIYLQRQKRHKTRQIPKCHFHLSQDLQTTDHKKCTIHLDLHPSKQQLDQNIKMSQLCQYLTTVTSVVHFFIIIHSSSFPSQRLSRYFFHLHNPVSLLASPSFSLLCSQTYVYLTCILKVLRLSLDYMHLLYQLCIPFKITKRPTK